jgi:acylphosphatase
MDYVRAHVFISGRVQGVNFRVATRNEARQAGVNGWVRNLSDGRVEAVFEGSNAAVRRLVSWCYSGPPAAEVERVELQWEEPTKSESSFSISY